MQLSSGRVVPALGGQGWLCRLPGAIVWAPGTGQSAAAFVAACLEASEPTDLLGRVGARLADPGAEPWPPFAILAARGEDLVAVVHGPVEVVVEREGGEAKLYGGDDVGSWLNRVVHGATAVSAGEGVEGDPLSDLREGVVRASGFLLAMTERAEGPWTAFVPERQGVAGDAVETGPESPTVAEPAVGGRAKDPVADFTVAEAAAEPERVGGAPERPVRAAPSQAVTVVMSAIGKLTWDNGEVDDLSRPVLIGRDVVADEAVVSGDLAPLQPSGQVDSMSRVHAELRVRGGEAVVVDRGSTNGTFVWDEPAKAWQRLDPGEPHVVQAGTVLAFGERTATFEPLS